MNVYFLSLLIFSIFDQGSYLYCDLEVLNDGNLGQYLYLFVSFQ